MLGLQSPGVSWAYALTILSTLLCVLYGIKNWNAGGPQESKEIEEELKWEEKEKNISESL